MLDKKHPRWKRRKRTTSIRRRLARIPGDRRLLREPDARSNAKRRTRDTRRRFLLGKEVLARLAECTGLTEIARRLLAVGLDANDRQYFGLQPGTPLVPIDEPGRGSGALTAARVASMTPAERKRRLESLDQEERALRRELRQLVAEDLADDEPADPVTHRRILVGAALLKLTEAHPRLTRWLKALLNARLKARRDRRLFAMGESGRLVLAEQPPDPPAARRAAKEADSGPQDRGGEPASGEDATARDTDAPIPGWKPCRISTSSAAGSGTRPATVWGARLTGVQRLAELPDDLCGRTITVTDSDNVSWDTKVTAVVSRNEKSAVVRNSGRPQSSGARLREKEGHSS